MKSFSEWQEQQPQKTEADIPGLAWQKARQFFGGTRGQRDVKLQNAARYMIKQAKRYYPELGVDQLLQKMIQTLSAVATGAGTTYSYSQLPQQGEEA